MRFCAGGATSAGNRRLDNDDAFRVSDHTCAVADGVGGQPNAHQASSIAVDVIVTSLTAGATSSATVHDAIAAANTAIRESVQPRGEPGSASTIVGVTVVEAGVEDGVRVVGEHCVAVFHVGDSRCYSLRNGVLDLVTNDHSIVGELCAVGRLRHADAASHPMANVLTRALGPEPEVVGDVVMLDAQPRRLLLCSDGLWSTLPARAIGRVLAGVADPQAAAERLVALVLEGAADDNVTAVVVDVVVDVLAGGGSDSVTVVDQYVSRPLGRTRPVRTTTTRTDER